MSSSQTTCTLPLRPALLGSDNTGLVNGNTLWSRAFDNVKATDEWSKYELVLQKVPGFTSTISAGSDDTENLANVIANIQTQLEQATARYITAKKVARKVRSILLAVKDAGTLVAALNPYAAVAWGTVQVLLSISANKSDVGRQCWEQLPTVVDLVCRFQTLEEIYEIPTGSAKSKTQFETDLVNLYTAIIKYQISVVIYAGSKTEKFKAALRGKTNSTFQQSLDSIKENQVTVRDSLHQLDREITDHQLRKLEQNTSTTQQTLQKLESEVHQSSSRLLVVTTILRQSQQDRILKWVSPYFHSNSHQRLEKTALEGTGQWLSCNKEFEDWYSAKESRLLWLRGSTGTGKSCLANHLINQLAESLDRANGEYYAYFYCDRTDPASKTEMENCVNIVRCLTKQLCFFGKTEIYQGVVAVWEEQRYAGPPSQRQCVDFIIDIVSHASATTLVIDGLDECDLSIQRQMMGVFRELMTRSRGVVKIFVSGRPELELILESPWTSVVDIHGQAEGDIATLIRYNISNALRDPWLQKLYVDESGSRADCVEDIMRRYAQGMFRWVQMAFAYLHASKHYAAMTRRLGKLHNLDDLFDLYDFIWSDMLKELDVEDKLALRTILSFVLYGFKAPERTLKFDKEIKLGGHGCDHVAAAAGYISSSGQNVDIVDFVRLCPNLVEYTYIPEKTWDGQDHDASTLRFQHFSVEEYLKHRHPEYTETNGHIWLATICMQMNVAEEGPIPSYQLDYWPHHLMKVKKLNQGGLQQAVNAHKEFGEAFHALLGGSEPSHAFQCWTKTTNLSADCYYVKTYGSGDALDWNAEPASTIFALIQLGLPVDTLSTASVSAIEYRGTGLRHMKPINAATFALKVGRSELLPFLEAHGIFPQDT